MKVAVLGGGGFVGSAIVRAAQRHGAETLSLGRADRTLERLSAYQPDLVVHAVSPCPWQEEEKRLDDLARLGIPAIAIGSAAVLAAAEPNADGRYSENARPVPVGDYGRFKLQQEESVFELRAKGWRASIARLFNPIGPGIGPHLMLGRLVREIIRREEDRNAPNTIEMGSLSAVRDFMHIDDAADGVLAIALTDARPPVVHVASGKGMAMRDVAQTAIALSTRTDLMLRETDQSPSESFGVPRVVGNPSLLHQLTGFTPIRTVAAAVEEALRSGKREWIGAH